MKSAGYSGKVDNVTFFVSGLPLFGAIWGNFRNCGTGRSEEKTDSKAGEGR